MTCRIFLVSCIVFITLSSCARDGGYTVVNSYYNLCLRGSTDIADAISLHSAVDFAYGTISYNGTEVDVYIGNHPDIGDYGEPPSVGSATRTALVYDGVYEKTQYLYVYGYKVDKTFGDHRIEMPIYVRLQVRDTQQQRMAARSLGERLELCPHQLVKDKQ